MNLNKTLNLFFSISLIALFLNACGEGGVDGSGNKPADSAEIQLFQSCFALEASNDCSNRDFNGDSFINYADLSLLKSAKRFDLNQDGYVDISFSDNNADRSILDICIGSEEVSCHKADFNGDKTIDANDVALFNATDIFDLNDDQRIDILTIADAIVDYSEDLDILINCLNKIPEGDCAASDLNGDKLINLYDTHSFTTASRFDLNGDNLIDYRNSNIEALSIETVNQDLKAFSNCYKVDLNIDTECSIADFNGDNLVNIIDFSIYNAGSKYDLDNNGLVDLRNVVESQDWAIFKNCYKKIPEGVCSTVDISGDGVINIIDFSMFSSGINYDLNGDNIVDLYGTDPASDQGFIISCLSQTSLSCLAADFDKNGIIDSNDLSLFINAVKFDINKDGFIDYRIRDVLKSEDKDILDSCLSQLAEGDCLTADFIVDGIVDTEDLNNFLASERFDLNLDHLIDLRNTDDNADLAIINECNNINIDQVPSCAIADLNNDSTVNIIDFSIFSNASKYDLNNDNFVDLHGLIEPRLQ